ncbi:hypothetical protein ACFZBU_39105 [Embleya sp. NPDC008237]|uniref:hypothetical protein n=1 Tax=Embleya sp. NPDC008237 TaxID=3363978 RepID=UPI0036E0332F
MPSTRRPAPANTVRTAAYLRCFPYDPLRTGPHLGVLLEYAEVLGLRAPDVFFDNGHLSSGPMPQLERLLAAIASGLYDVVLVPGPFVLALDDDKAREILRWMRAQGCEVVELPSPRTGTGTGTGTDGTGRRTVPLRDREPYDTTGDVEGRSYEARVA